MNRVSKQASDFKTESGFLQLLRTTRAWSAADDPWVLGADALDPP